MSTNTILYLVAKTHMGRVRELNEDNFIATERIRGTDWLLPKVSYTNPPEGSIIAVADGMGGTNAGEVASTIAIESVKGFFRKKDPTGYKDENILSELKQAILFAHRAILQKAKKDAALRDMGTTLIIGWIFNGKFFTAWSGDSRCYYYRRSTGLRQLSKDHSYVQTLVDAGEITAEQAFFHPQSNIVTQSLGDAERAPEPDTAILTLVKGDVLLLCSDGLSGMLTDAQIEEIIKENEDNMNQCADQLIDQANEAGGGDNITVILSKVIDGKEPSAEDDEPPIIPGPIKKKRKGRSRLILLLLFSLLVSMALPFVVFRSDPKPGSVNRKESSRRDSTGAAPSTQPGSGVVRPGGGAPHSVPPVGVPPPVPGKKSERPKGGKAGDSLRTGRRVDTIRLHVLPPDQKPGDGPTLHPEVPKQDSATH